MRPNPVPADCPTVSVYLHVAETARLIDFMKHAFGGVEVARIVMPDGQIAHARVRIGDSMVMLSLPHAPWPAHPAMLYHYVADVDATYRQALATGAESAFAPRDMFYGDRLAVVKDFAGNHWSLASRIENITLAEIQKRVSGFGPAPDQNAPPV